MISSFPGVSAFPSEVAKVFLQLRNALIYELQRACRVRDDFHSLPQNVLAEADRTAADYIAGVKGKIDNAQINNGSNNYVQGGETGGKKWKKKKQECIEPKAEATAPPSEGRGSSLNVWLSDPLPPPTFSTFCKDRFKPCLRTFYGNFKPIGMKPYYMPYSLPTRQPNQMVMLLSALGTRQSVHDLLSRVPSNCRTLTHVCLCFTEAFDIVLTTAGDIGIKLNRGYAYYPVQHPLAMAKVEHVEQRPTLVLPPPFTSWASTSNPSSSSTATETRTLPTPEPYPSSSSTRSIQPFASPSCSSPSSGSSSSSSSAGSPPMVYILHTIASFPGPSAFPSEVAKVFLQLRNALIYELQRAGKVRDDFHSLPQKVLAEAGKTAKSCKAGKTECTKPKSEGWGSSLNLWFNNPLPPPTFSTFSEDRFKPFLSTFYGNSKPIGMEPYRMPYSLPTIQPDQMAMRVSHLGNRLSVRDLLSRVPSNCRTLTHVCLCFTEAFDIVLTTAGHIGIKLNTGYAYYPVKHPLAMAKDERVKRWGGEIGTETAQNSLELMPIGVKRTTTTATPHPQQQQQQRWRQIFPHYKDS
eukprot:GHVS01090284.1.p1 GENE.GHVS01090284.1~~GHVS01090284.1.p1  ORF type:complete len:669 (-),score=100.25 GHVS01090284.1:374-2110(-)